MDLLSEATFSPTESCVNSPTSWTDDQGDSCSEYASTPANCPYTGIGTDGKKASQACCACEGGLGTVNWKPTNYDSGDEKFVKVSVSLSDKMTVDNKILTSVCGLTNRGTIQCINGNTPVPNQDFTEINSSYVYTMGLANPLEKDGGKILYSGIDSSDPASNYPPVVWSPDTNNV